MLDLLRYCVVSRALSQSLPRETTSFIPKKDSSIHDRRSAFCPFILTGNMFGENLKYTSSLPKAIYNSIVGGSTLAFQSDHSYTVCYQWTDLT